MISFCKAILITIIFFFVSPFLNPFVYGGVINKCNLNIKNFSSEKMPYILGPGDVLNINIFSNSNLSGEYQILSDGSVSMPVIGSVFLSGLTLTESINKLEDIFDKELYSPSLDVTLINFRPLSISIIGEIERPGTYRLDKKNIFDDKVGRFQPYSSTPRLVDAIQIAGGITSEADTYNVCLIRKVNGTGKLSYLKINLASLIKNGDQSNNPYLYDEDIIKINKIDVNKSFDENLLNSSIASEFITINVIGEVKNPGSKKIKNNANLIDAISSADGVIEENSNGSAQIVRIKKNGALERFNVRFDLSKNNKKNYLKIKDGDTVYIKRGKITNASALLMKVTDPLVNILQIFSFSNDINNPNN